MPSGKYIGAVVCAIPSYYVVIAREAYSVNALLGIRRVRNEREAITILFTCIRALNALHGCAFITRRSLCVICIIDVET